MAQGRRPASCCLSQECLLSGGKKEQGAKSHIGLRRADGRSSGSKLASIRQGLGHSFGVCSANKEQRSPSGGTALSSANTKLAASLSGCLHGLFIYSVPGACPLAGFFVGLLSLCHLGAECLLYLSVQHRLTSCLILGQLIFSHLRCCDSDVPAHKRPVWFKVYNFLTFRANICCRVR